MTAAQNLKIYQLLRNRYGDVAGVAAAVAEIEEVLNAKVSDSAAHLATLHDLAEAKADVFKWMAGVFAALSLLMLGLFALK